VKGTEEIKIMSEKYNINNKQNKEYVYNLKHSLEENEKKNPEEERISKNIPNTEDSSSIVKDSNQNANMEFSSRDQHLNL
jgi:hypothetical protein